MSGNPPDPKQFFISSIYAIVKLMNVLIELLNLLKAFKISIEPGDNPYKLGQEQSSSSFDVPGETWGPSTEAKSAWAFYTVLHKRFFGKAEDCAMVVASLLNPPPVSSQPGTSAASESEAPANEEEKEEKKKKKKCKPVSPVPTDDLSPAPSQPGPSQPSELGVPAKAEGSAPEQSEAPPERPFTLLDASLPIFHPIPLDFPNVLNCPDVRDVLLNALNFAIGEELSRILTAPPQPPLQLLPPLRRSTPDEPDTSVASPVPSAGPTPDSPVAPSPAPSTRNRKRKRQPKDDSPVTPAKRKPDSDKDEF